MTDAVPIWQLVRLLGEPDAMRVVEHFGGRSVYIPTPQRLTPQVKVAQAIGVEATRRLAMAFPGERIGVPLGASFFRRARDRAIRRDASTLSAWELAAKYRMTERSIYRIIERGKTPSPMAPTQALSTSRGRRSYGQHLA